MRQLLALGSTCVISIGIASVLGTNVSAFDGPDAPGGPEFYAKRVKPILEANCLQCHDQTARGGLQLDSYASIGKGGQDGSVIVPGDPDASLLIQAIRRSGDLKMPPKAALGPSDVAILEAWVKSGAVGSDSSSARILGTGKPGSDGSQKPANGSNHGSVGKGTTSELDADFFENKVRPIFANHCYDCHTDSASGGLRLDSKAAFDRGGGRGKLIVSGDPERSLLIQAVRQTGALKMPKGGKLGSDEVGLLVEWVRHGAPWPATSSAAITSITAKTGTITEEQRKFWSFQPLKHVKPPSIDDPRLARWAQTAIDHFILAGLHRAGLAPALVADRRTLIRRATFDLVGLPPTQAEVEAFTGDKSNGAWEKVIDRLLASPRYGERWGRHWLDVARYAEDDVRGLDPKGRGYMPFAGAFRYRDWVIKAFNDDIPYDRFVTMQLAGDKLPIKDQAERQNNLTATTYLGAGPWVWDQAEPIQGRADERNERVDSVTRGLLGLTVACARCHNHKYDPIPQKDYYKVVGIFANSTYTEYPVVSKIAAEAWDQKNFEAARLQANLKDYTTDLGKQLAESLSVQISDYTTAAWSVLGKPKKTVDEVSADKHLDPEVLQRWVDYLQKDHTYPYLDDWKAMTASLDSAEDQARAVGDAFQKEVLHVQDENAKIEEENDIVRAKNDVPKHRLLDAKPSEFETFDQFCPGCQLELKALPTFEAKLYLDLFVTQSGDMDEKFVPGVMFFNEWNLTRRLGPQWQTYIESQQKRIKSLENELKESEYPYVHGMADKPKIVDVKLNVRGNPHSVGDVTPRGFLTVLSPPEKPAYSDGSGRLEFATDIVQQPITSRVIVNRIWKWHFGTGLVNTPDNFGIMGDKPSNPELLEYLATEFVNHKRSIKWLQRQILLSAVYQSAAEESHEAHDKDPGNRLYSHFDRQRLDAEELRDSMLFVAGDLDLKETSGPSTVFTSDNLRRTVFCKVSRYRLNNYLMVFDFPNPSFTAEQRFTSNVPLQQLHFMNNAFVYKQARVLAEGVHSEVSDEARIAKAYQLLFQRKPTPDEVQLGLKFLSTTPEKPGYTIEGKPVTAWSEYARVLFSSNEFQFLN